MENFENLIKKFLSSMPEENFIKYLKSYGIEDKNIQYFKELIYKKEEKNNGHE